MAITASTSTSPPWWSPKTFLRILFINFGLFFQTTCAVLTLLYSVFIYPFSFKKYRQFISYAMRMWSINLVALIQWFAPADIIMTFDSNCGDMDEIIKRDPSTGDISKLVLPDRIILTANHQVYNCHFTSALNCTNANLDICRLDIYLDRSTFSRRSWCHQNYIET